ncbi:spore germination protein GerPE [Bacillus mexicanus]|uniref:spore germination protein GerPE n=1 Tax=Bacillus TaxID=1386 RepID=UPI001389D3FE|nr:spore gernimation protein GerPE [Bacillus sp. SKDU12]
MLKRIPRIRMIKFNSLGIASVFQAGDTNEIDMKLKVLAVQRSQSTFYSNEGSFNRKEYQIFQQHAPLPIPETGVQSAFYHEVPIIQVHNIKIQGVSSSSVFHAGSVSLIRGDARIKHIRQIQSPPRSQSPDQSI